MGAQGELSNLLSIVTSSDQPPPERYQAVLSIARNRSWRRPALEEIAPLLLRESGDFAVTLIFAMRDFPATSELRRSLIAIAADTSRTTEERTAAIELLSDSRFRMPGRFFVPFLVEEGSAIRFWACDAVRWRGNLRHIADLTPLLEDHTEIAVFGSVAECARRAIDSIEER